jgi:hypothetical protein
METKTLNPHLWDSPKMVGQAEYTAIHELATSVWNSNEGSDQERGQQVLNALEELAKVIRTVALQYQQVVDPKQAEVDAIYRQAADDEHGREGEIEVDHDAIISHSEDGGAYVQAWVWVYKPDDICDECGGPAPDGGDGYDGKCAECADAEEKGDDLCDLCYSSEVNVERTTYCGKTIGIECGCDATNEDGMCNNPDCEECAAEGEDEEEDDDTESDTADPVS